MADIGREGLADEVWAEVCEFWGLVALLSGFFGFLADWLEQLQRALA